MLAGTDPLARGFGWSTLANDGRRSLDRDTVLEGIGSPAWSRSRSRSGPADHDDSPATPRWRLDKAVEQWAMGAAVAMGALPLLDGRPRDGCVVVGG